MKAFIEKLTPMNLRFQMAAAYRHAQAAVLDGAYEVVIRACTKSRDQEEHYHALIGDIAEQYEHFGRKWDEEGMKRLLVAAFKHETKADPINYPGFDKLWAQVGDLTLAPPLRGYGESFVTLGDQTRKFPVKLAAGFITWLYAFMYENGVYCTNPKYQQQKEAA